MNDNILLLKIHWTKDNCANVVFQTSVDPSPVKIKRMKNALQFVGSLNQQYYSFVAGASHTDEMLLKNNDEDNTWVFHSSFVKGIVSIMLLFNTRKDTRGFRKVFLWRGALCDFRFSLYRLLQRLDRYPFFERLIAAGKRIVAETLRSFDQPRLVST